MEETISAIATALGEGAVGIVRISGTKALTLSNTIFKGTEPLQAAASRHLTYGHIVDEEGNVVDEVLAVFMPGPHSYTGEDVVEIQCHGGIEALKAILALTYRQGAKPAEPGEFTKRAFLNGRLDLSEAEAVMDIINARSAQALSVAVRTQKGQLSQQVSKIRQGLKDLIVHLEATIDYPEDDIEDVTYEETEQGINKAIEAITDLLAHAHTGRIMREGLRTAIVGKPNVGKSSLLNCLLKSDRAIVSSVPGTTRDVIEEQMLIEGVPLLLADTAGLRDTDDYVEKIGVQKSREILADAELAIVVLDGSGPLDKADRELLDLVKDRERVIIINKGDLPPKLDKAPLAAEFGASNVLELSVKTQAGVEEFITWLKNYVYGQGCSVDKGIFVQNARQEDLLREARQSLTEAKQGAVDHLPYDCIEIDTREAMAKLGEITGEAVPDEVINEIFARFCLGK